MNYDYNILLEYISAKGSGKWQEFKTIVQNLNYDDSSEISNNEIRRMLSSLGHVEFLFKDDEQIYSVAPSGIALINNSFKGVLCGFRTARLVENLKKECEQNDIFVKVKAQENAPDAIFIYFGNEEKLNSFLEKSSLNLYVTKNFSYRLLKSLPDIDTILNDIKKEKFSVDITALNVFSYDVFQGKKRLVKNRITKDYNLYQRQFFNKSEHFLFLGDDFYKIDKNYGECITYSKSALKLLKYQNDKLQVNIVNLPELIDRALTLSSGLNRKSSYPYAKYIYDNISLDIAKLVSEKTGLLLEIING